MSETLEAEGEVVLDPNAFSEDGTVSLAGWYPSETGKYMAYSTSDGVQIGAVHVMNLETGETSRTSSTGSNFQERVGVRTKPAFT